MTLRHLICVFIFIFHACALAAMCCTGNIVCVGTVKFLWLWVRDLTTASTIMGIKPLRCFMALLFLRIILLYTT